MTGAAIDPPNATLRAQSLRNAGFDLVLVLAILISAKEALLRVEALWTYAGPISLLLALCFAHWRLRSSNGTWGELGFRLPKSWLKIAIWTVVALVATTAAGLILGGIAEGFFETQSSHSVGRSESRFASLPGNELMLLYWLIVAWIIGGFVEEMLFRAYLITRFETLFSGVPFGLIFAVIIPAVLFGQQHFYYQGLSGAVATGAVGLVAGALYVWLKRGLLPLILSHGLANTIGLTLIYAGIQSPT